MKQHFQKSLFLIVALLGSIPVLSATQARQALSSTIESVAGAVATISTTQIIKGPQQCHFAKQTATDGFDFDELEEAPSDFNDPIENPHKIQSAGSGFVIQSDENSAFIVTNYHVIAQADTISIVLNDHITLDATVFGVDDRSDLAVLKVTTNHLPKDQQKLATLEWGNSQLVKVGDFVYAIGNSFGLGNSTTHGIISNLSRRIGESQTNRDYSVEFIQHSAPIHKGNSGGPLLNLEGKVIGINTAILSPHGNQVGIGFCIPSATAKGRVRQLIDFGRVRRGWLGLKTQGICADDMSEQFIEKSKSYKIVSSVTPLGPADKASIKPGDVILEYDGREMTEKTSLNQMINDTPVGQTVKIKLMRAGKIITVDAILEEIDQPDFAKPSMDQPPKSSVINT